MEEKKNYSPDARVISKKLEAAGEMIEVRVEKEVTSTNDELKELARTQKKGCFLLVAEGQTKGRGRMGRSFYSPDKSGIYMSLLLRPKLEAKYCTLITAAAAAAAAKAIEGMLGIETGIKWVNDIYANGKKVAGILTESAFCGSEISYSVVGIGINITAPEGDFPRELREIASALTKKEGPDTKNDLIAETVKIFMEYYRALPEKIFMEEYRRRLLYLGEKITVHSPQGDYTATAEAIDEMCRLTVRLESGEERTLQSGEISIRSLHGTSHAPDFSHI